MIRLMEIFQFLELWFQRCLPFLESLGQGNGLVVV